MKRAVIKPMRETLVVNPKTIRSLCKGCGREGPVALFKSPRRASRPSWCRCPKNRGGPYVAPPGYVAKFTF